MKSMTTLPDGTTSEYGLFDYLSIIRKRWIWMLLPVVAMTLVSAFWSSTRAPSYEASARVLLADTAVQRTLDPSSQNTGFLSRELSNEISLARSDLVETLVEGELGQLPSMTIRAEQDADILVFVSRADSAEEAAENANSWARQYIQVKRDEAGADLAAATASLGDRLEELRLRRQEIRAPLDALDDRIAATTDSERALDLQRQYDRLSDDLRYELELVTGQAQATMASLSDLELQAEFASVGEARLVQAAAPPLSSSNPPLSRNVALGLTMGLLAGFGLALLAEHRDNTITAVVDIASITDLPVLASVPEAAKRHHNALPTATHREPEGAFASGYHRLRAAIEFAGFEQDLRTVLVTSANAAEGKSTTASNLALAFASTGRKTVLLDVDFRRPRQHEIYGVAQVPGLSDVALYGVEPPSVAYSLDEPGLETLLVVPAGTEPPSPAAFVSTDGFVRAVDWIRGEAELVVMDAPPMLAVSDPQTMAKHADSVVLTARSGQTTKNELLEAIVSLGQVGANVVGVILIGANESETYGRQSYYRSEQKATRKTPASADPQLWGQSNRVTTIDLTDRLGIEPESKPRVEATSAVNR